MERGASGFHRTCARRRSRVGRLEVDSFDAREHIDPIRGDADLEDRSLHCEVVDAQVAQRGAETHERAVNALCIRPRGADPNVEILRVARLREEHHGVGADDDNSAPSSDNAENRSLKSGLTGIFSPEGSRLIDHLPCRLEHSLGPLLLPESAVERAVVSRSSSQGPRHETPL